MKSSFQKIHTSSSSASSVVTELHKALEEATALNAKHQEQIQILTTERDAAESGLYDSKRHSRSLEEDFSHSDRELEQTRALLLEARLQNEALQADLKIRDQQVEQLKQHATRQESELLQVTHEKLDHEDWIAEIKARVKEANTHYNKLENRVQTQNGTILQLKAGCTLLQDQLRTDNSNAEMNKKALLRSNADLKREVEKLQKEVEAEKEKKKTVKPAIDWRSECMRIHRRKSLQIEKLEAEIEQLRLKNLEQCGEIESLKQETLTAAASTECSPPTARPTMAQNSISEVVALVDILPSDVPADNFKADGASQGVGVHRSEAIGTLAGPMVILGCLFAAWFLRQYIGR